MSMALDESQVPSAQELLSLPRLAPLVPMLYVAWTDGELTHEEIRALGSAARAQPWLDLRSSAVLARWLDPLNPPTPSALAQLREHIRRTAERLEPQRTAEPGGAGHAARRGAQRQGRAARVRCRSWRAPWPRWRRRWASPAPRPSAASCPHRPRPP